MKKIILILIISGATFNKTNAQTSPVSDTLAYLQMIVANKANYIGHPFSVLINDMQIEVKYFFPYASLPYNKNKETSTSLSFYFPQNIDDLYLTYPRLEIYWYPYLNKSQSNIIRQTNNNRGYWNWVAASFYSPGIIADIKLEN